MNNHDHDPKETLMIAMEALRLIEHGLQLQLEVHMAMAEQLSIGTGSIKAEAHKDGSATLTLEVKVNELAGGGIAPLVGVMGMAVGAITPALEDLTLRMAKEIMDR